MTVYTETYNTFDKDNHLKPDFDKASFDTLHSWDFGWAALELINIAEDEEHEKLLSKRLSPGQKALYFFWYLDAQVTNGGFIQFYVNDYRKYLPPILAGLKLIGDNELLALVEKADHEFLANQGKFEAQMKTGNITPAYDDVPVFEGFDGLYYEIHDHTMALIEQYARNQPGNFFNLIG